MQVNSFTKHLIAIWCKLFAESKLICLINTRYCGLRYAKKLDGHHHWFNVSELSDEEWRNEHWFWGKNKEQQQPQLLHLFHVVVQLKEINKSIKYCYFDYELSCRRLVLLNKQFCNNKRVCLVFFLILLWTRVWEWVLQIKKCSVIKLTHFIVVISLLLQKYTMPLINVCNLSTLKVSVTL